MNYHCKNTLFYLLYFLLFGIPIANTIAQDDRLQQLLKSQKITDKPDIDFLNDNSKRYRNQNKLDSAILIAEKTISLAQNLSYPKGEANAYMRLGIAYRLKGEFSKAIGKLDKGLQLRQEMNDSSSVASAWNSLGSTYRHLKDFDSAFICYEHNIDICQALNKPKKLAKAYHSMGLYFSERYYVDEEQQKEYAQEAETYLRKSIAITKEAKLLKSWANSLEAIANIRFYQKRYQEALDLHQKVLELRTEGNLLLYDSYLNLGNCYSKLANHRLAIEFLLKAWSGYEYSSFLFDKASIKNNLGEAYKALARYNEAEQYYLEGLNINQKLGSDGRDQRRQLYYNLAKIHELQSEFKPAYEFYEKYAYLRDTIIDEENTISIAQMEAKYKVVESELEVSKITQKEVARTLERNVAIAVGVSTVLIISLLAWQQSQKRKSATLLRLENEKVHDRDMTIKDQELAIKDQAIDLEKQKTALHQEKVTSLLQEQEIKLLRAKTEGEEKEKERISKDLHDRIGSHLTTAKIHLTSMETDPNFPKRILGEAYHKGIELLDQVCEDIRTTSHELSTSILAQFGLISVIDSLKDRIEQSEVVQVEFVHTGMNQPLSQYITEHVYRCIQIAVDNILKHANATEITIQLIQQNQELDIMISDNGDGFDLEKAKQKKSLGIMHLEERVEQLEGTLHIDTTIGHGSTIIINQIPIKN